MKKINEHLEIAQKSYWQHLLFATKAGFVLIYAGIISIIHGICPLLFPFRSAQIVMKFAHIVLQKDNTKEIPDEFSEYWDIKKRNKT